MNIHARIRKLERKVRPDDILPSDIEEKYRINTSILDVQDLTNYR